MSRAATSGDALQQRAAVSPMSGELYYGAVVNEETLRARFDLIEIDGEGILLDRESGGVYHLNRTACEIWTAVLDGKSAAEITAALTRRFAVNEERAARDVVAAIDRIPDAPRKPSSDPCRWEATASGYAFFDDTRLIFEIDPTGSWLRLSDSIRPTENQTRGYLKSVAPKVLALHGVFVLHASAVEIDGKLLVFSGRSGAGKTTSARAFARPAARLVSEDLLVMAGSADEPRAVLGGEPAITSWIVEQAQQLARSPEQTVSCEGLDRCVEGRQLPLAEILMVDADRRAGHQIQREQLTRADALVALIESIYFASANASTWHERLDRLRALTRDVSLSRATMPPGLPQLQTAADEFLRSL